MARDDFERLRAIVHADEELQDELLDERDKPPFVPLLVRIAAERGIAITDIDVWDALAEGDAAWLATWSP